MAPCDYVGFYDDGVCNQAITNAMITKQELRASWRETLWAPVVREKSDYEKALDELNHDFPGADIAEILENTRDRFAKKFQPKNTMLDAFQNLRYQVLLLLREIFK